MENITLSLWIIAMALQITLLVALTAIAQTLRRSNGICSPFWLVIFFWLYSLGQYADPFLVRLLTESVIAFAVPDSSVSLVQLFSFLSSIRLISILLAAFCLLALVLADLSHFWRGADDTRPSRWFQRFELFRHHRLGIGLAMVLLVIAHPTLLAGLLLSSS